VLLPDGAMLVVRQTQTSDTVKYKDSCILSGLVVEKLVIGVNHPKARAAGLVL